MILSGFPSTVQSQTSDLLKAKNTQNTPLLTEKDMKQMEYQTAMNGLVSDVKNILIKLSDRQEQTKDAVKDIEHIQENTHKRIGRIDSTLDVLKQVITKDSISESVRDGLKDLKLAN